MTEIVLVAEEIERNRDKMNMRPALEFIEQNAPQYQANVDRFLGGEGYKKSRELADSIDFFNLPEDGVMQITPELVRRIISHVSPELTKLSKLKKVDYTWHNKVAVPNFGPDGNLNKDSACIGVLGIEEFLASKHHKERMLIGNTAHTGDVVRMTAVPPTVSSDPKAIELYQTHVFLHEFFHTIECPVRSEEASSRILLNKSGRTFADWSRDYLESLNDEPELTTQYAEGYADRIFDGQRHIQNGVTPYDASVREDMAEAWVASHFDIISNLSQPEPYRSFAAHSFGNPKSAGLLRDHSVASRKALLMRELREAHITCIPE